MNVEGNVFDFTGVEPLVVHGLSDFHMITPDDPADLAVDTVNVADLNLTNLVLHTLTIDGVVTWTQQAKLVTPDALETKHTGISSAMSSDGNTLVVGAELQGSSSGVVYVYTWDNTSNGWIEQAKLYASDRGNGGQGFGDSVAISGNRIIVGAPGDNTYGTDSGAAYVFVNSGGGWHQEAKLKASDGVAGAKFGESVSISGTTAVVGAFSGADYGYVFTVSITGIWSQQQKITSSTESNYTTSSGSRYMYPGYEVLVSQSYNPNLGERGTVYRYVGSGGVIVNLGTQDYINSSDWQQVHGGQVSDRE